MPSTSKAAKSKTKIITKSDKSVTPKISPSPTTAANQTTAADNNNTASNNIYSTVINFLILTGIGSAGIGTSSSALVYRIFATTTRVSASHSQIANSTALATRPNVTSNEQSSGDGGASILILCGVISLTIMIFFSL